MADKDLRKRLAGLFSGAENDAGRPAGQAPESAPPAKPDRPKKKKPLAVAPAADERRAAEPPAGEPPQARRGRRSDRPLSVADGPPPAPENGQLGQPDEGTRPDLAEIEGLYQATVNLQAAQSYDDILAVLREHLAAGQQVQHLSLHYFDQPWGAKHSPQRIQVLARWPRAGSAKVDSSYTLANYASLRALLKPDTAVLIEDAATDARLDEDLKQLYRRLRAGSVVIAPLTVGGQWVGFLTMIFAEAIIFPEEAMRMWMAVIGQAAAAVQHFRNLEQAQIRAKQEQAVRTITAKIRCGADTQAILRATLEELNQVLGASGGIIRLGTQAQLLMQHSWTNEHEKNDP